MHKRIGIVFCCMTVTTFMYAAESAQHDFPECNQAYMHFPGSIPLKEMDRLEKQKKEIERERVALVQQQQHLQQQWYELLQQKEQFFQQPQGPRVLADFLLWREQSLRNLSQILHTQQLLLEQEQQVFADLERAKKEMGERQQLGPAVASHGAQEVIKKILAQTNHKRAFLTLGQLADAL